MSSSPRSLSPAACASVFLMLLFAPVSAGLLAPPAQAQEAARSPSALPPSPRGFLLDPDALAQGTAEARIDAQRAARLRPAPTPIHAPDDATPRAATKASETRGPAGNARFPAWNLAPTTGERFNVYTNVAYGQITRQYDDSEERVPLSNPIPTQRIGLVQVAELLGLDPETAAGAAQFIDTDVRVPGRIEGEVTTINFNLGGIVNLLRTDRFDLSIGADFQAAQQNFSADQVVLEVENARGDLTFVPAFLQIPGVENLDNGTVAEIAQELRDVNENSSLDLTIPPDDQIPSVIEMEDSRNIESGFQTQALTLFLQAQNQFLSARGGFQFDLGPEPDLAAGEREVSDRQNAILLGLTGSFPSPVTPLRVYGGVDGWITLEGQRDTDSLLTVSGQVVPPRDDVSYDEGNTYAAQMGAEYTFFERLALGVGLTFRYRTAPTLDGEKEGDGGFHLGLAPYANYTPPGAPFSLYLKGGVRDEYRDFSFSIAGENEFAPRAGATLGAAYRF